MQKIQRKKRKMPIEINEIASCKNLPKTLLELVGNEEIIDKFAQSPKDVMEYALSLATDEIKTDFASTIGLWEGFTLGEHTESVMTFFQENFADTLNCSKQTRAMLNLIIFCHDIGKAEEKRRVAAIGDDIYPKEKFDLYNEKAVKFFKSLNIDEKDGEKLALFITNLTQILERRTTNHYVRDMRNSLTKLDEECERILNENDFDSSEDSVKEFELVARVLQTCDSGAYTTYGKTRDAETNEYRPNLNKEWTKGFVATKYGYRFKKDAPENVHDGEEIVQ